MDMKKIVMIDDEENFCKLVKKNVEKTGEFEVHIATDGESGMKLVGELNPDLILLDVVMPEMDGPDVAARIRENKSTKDIPIVFLTAMLKEDESDQEAGFTMGYSLLAKTATVGELMECIRKNVRRCPEA